MDAVEQKGLIVKETRRNRLSNRLVITTTTDSPLAVASPRDLGGSGVRRLAVGDPKTVPVGAYTREYLIGVEFVGHRGIEARAL